MTTYFNRQGKPITMEEFSLLFEDRSYQSIVKTTVGDYMISTVWLGLDHGHDSGLPMIFETMVFPRDDWNEIECERYATEDAAIHGHFTMVVKYMGEFPDEDEVLRVGTEVQRMIRELNG